MIFLKCSCLAQDPQSEAEHVHLCWLDRTDTRIFRGRDDGCYTGMVTSHVGVVPPFFSHSQSTQPIVYDRLADQVVLIPQVTAWFSMSFSLDLILAGQCLCVPRPQSGILITLTGLLIWRLRSSRTGIKRTDTLLVRVCCQNVPTPIILSKSFFPRCPVDESRGEHRLTLRPLQHGRVAQLSIWCNDELCGVLR